jgi:hypothetical protein
MRIVQDTPDRMVLKDRTLWISFICGPIGLLLVAVTAIEPSWGSGIGAAICLFGAVVFFDSTDLVMDRAARLCDLRRMNYGRTRRWSLRFDEVTDVRIERGSTTRAGGRTCRLVFVTPTETIPLTAALSSGEARYQAMHERVLAVLRDQTAPPPPNLPPPPPPQHQADIVQPG